ncbi:MAG: hypothetical protein JWQ01_4930 [Massilia sp.]|nr:hypothetical protein [Massilia sp.]
MSNVREVEFAKPPVNSDVVAMLEQWLERAKDGRLQSVGVAGVKSDGTVSTEWRGLAGGWLHQMNSAVLILQYRIMTANVEPE